MLPVAARWHPPETGHSAASPPRAITSAPRRCISAASVVDISIQILPGPTSGIISLTTLAQAAGDGRQVITTSQSRIMPAALPPAFAPRPMKSATSAGSRSWTARSTPLRNNDPASLPPTLPRPMKPTFMPFLRACILRQFVRQFRRRLSQTRHILDRPHRTECVQRRRLPPLARATRLTAGGNPHVHPSHTRTAPRPARHRRRRRQAAPRLRLSGSDRAGPVPALRRFPQRPPRGLPPAVSPGIRTGASRPSPMCWKARSNTAIRWAITARWVPATCSG